jgi:hypothetical protein
VTKPDQEGVKGMDEIELAAARKLRAELEDHFLLAADASYLVHDALAVGTTGDFRDWPVSKRVCVVLLVRIVNDLRSAALLVQRGYPLQAITIVASIFEESFTVAYVGDSEARAARWGTHRDPNHPFQDVRTMVREVLRTEPSYAAALRNELECYSQLCWAKHANPFLQRQHGIRFAESQVEIWSGPSTDVNAVRAAWFALDHGARLAVAAVAHFDKRHLRGAATDRMVELTSKILDRRDELVARAHARGWGLNPFPDGWLEGTKKQGRSQGTSKAAKSRKRGA